MKISALKNTPSAKELLKILKGEAPKYSSQLFGLGSDKTVIVRKSTFVGVQISKRENEISVDGTHPFVLTSVLSSILMSAGLSYLIEAIFYKEWKKLEAEIGDLLKLKYC
ncbi:MAG: hypothetical protein ABJF04_11175 [Reichenbachiella sp.]|uniref:hypothetical protein n=1 Tax=Reichenbachiella sp. TaxID=2184521 RepID=UPI003262FD71